MSPMTDTNEPEEKILVLKDETVTSCPGCGVPIKISTNKDCFEINGAFAAECEDEILRMRYRCSRCRRIGAPAERCK